MSRRRVSVGGPRAGGPGRIPLGSSEGAVLEISRTENPRGLRLAGEVDLATVDEFSLALEPEVEEGGDITIDLSDLTFLGSSGVHVLIRALVSLEGRGRLVLLRPLGSVRRLLEVMDLRRFENLEVREGT